MSNLFYDTETTGFYNFRAEPEDPEQPRIVQLAWAFDEGTDITGKVSWYDFIIFPENWIIPSDSIAIHGISNEVAKESGLPILEVMEKFLTDYKKSDRIIAHNINFDNAIVNSQLARLGKDPLPEKEKICTMHSTTDILKLPGRYGKYKWPKLEEAYCFLVNSEGFEGAHNALNDVRACRELYYNLKESRMIP